MAETARSAARVHTPGTRMGRLVEFVVSLDVGAPGLPICCSER